MDYIKVITDAQTGNTTEVPMTPEEIAAFTQENIPTAEQNKQTAMQLLQQTDWVNQPDVRNTAVSPHLLNGAEFDAYRVAVRQYAVYPVEGNIEFPVKPEERWGNAVVVEEPVVQEGI